MVSSPIDADDLIIYTLNGLPAEYNSFKTSIRTRSSAISIEELHVLLLVEELNMEVIDDRLYSIGICLIQIHW